MLKVMIKNEIDKDKGLASKLASIAGFKNPSSLYKFLNEPEREIDNFSAILDMINFLFPDREHEIMNDYCRTLDPNKHCARVSLEYATLNGLYDLMEYLLNSLSNSTNSESKEWASFYQVEYDRRTRKINSKELIKQLNSLTPKRKEMFIFNNLVLMMGYHGLKILDQVFHITEDLEEEILDIKDEYIKATYHVRLMQMLSTVLLHYNKVNESRECAEKSIPICKVEYIRGTMYHRLGHTYIFENYEKAIENLKIARSIFVKDKPELLSVIESSICFTQNFWNKTPEYLHFESEEISDKHEVAYYYIRSKNNVEAEKILNSIDMNSMNDYQKGFHFYYKGLINEDKNYFYTSIEHFMKSGDKFYRNISLIELEKMGENPILLRTLSV